MIAVLLVLLVLAADIACSRQSIYNMIDEYMGGGMKIADREEKDASYLASADVGLRISEEGMVLLKNENQALPLTGVTKVNLFGCRSANLYTSGTGSGASSGSASLVDTLQTGFAKVGIEVNPDLYSKYAQYYSANKKNVKGSDFSFYEPAITDQSFYSEALWAEYLAYSPVAILVLGRTGGEGRDEPHGYLSITDAESALLHELEARFETVIVLINAGNAMEMGFVEDSGVDAAMLINNVGNNGAYAAAKIIAGEVNPSGRTVDTFAYDHSTAPNYYTAGLEATRAYGGIENHPYTGMGYYYIDYTEGIYVGYKYYETRFVDNVTGAVDEAAYRQTVQYPFGYGLSYTTFKQEIVDSSLKDGGAITGKAGDEITVKVKVTNTGSVAGKDVVQFYFTAPYYPGGIEKSHVELAAFGKTKELKPGESDTVTLSFSLFELAAFDYNDANTDGHKGYELEKGAYVFSIRFDAHTVIESFTGSVAETVYFDADPVTGAAITTLFDDVAGGSETEEIVYLSRSDWTGTWTGWDGKPDSTAGTDWAGFTGTYTVGRDASETVLSSVDSVVWTNYADNDPADAEMPVTGAQNGLTIADLAGKSYDDPLWDKLLDQMTVEEMQTLIGQGGYIVSAVPSVGLGRLSSKDGPTSINAAYSINDGKGSAACFGYPSETMVANTWNTELAYEQGVAISREANAVSVDQWYALAVNIHRSPYGGRNYEYYSEDALISGKMGAAVINGTKENGLVATMKHYAVNEQETCRNMNGLYTWCNEQALREIYLKAFEIAVKEGDCNALMSSFNRIGAKWTGGSKALCTDLLRTEWGFVGFIETDAFFPFAGDSTYYMEFNTGVRAGNDMWLQSGSSYTVSTEKSEAYSVQMMRNAAHNILYVFSNTDGGTTGTPGWVIALIAVSAVIYALAAAWFVVLVVNKRKKNSP